MIWQFNPQSYFSQGTWGYRRVLKAFPSHTQAILQPNGELNREALAGLVFNDTLGLARRRLNKATHFPVLFDIIKQIAGHWIAFTPVVVIDMPLLFETGFSNLTRPNILVACSPELQLQRLRDRNNMAQEDAEARVASQMPVDQKLKLADVIINNDGTLEELKDKVIAIQQMHLQRWRWLHRTVLSPAGVATVGALLWRLLQYQKL
jgi:dephospho-CoA kinase